MILYEKENWQINKKDKKIIEHLKWFYPRNEIVSMGDSSYGIKFQIMMHKHDFDMINNIGFDIENIQPNVGNKPANMPLNHGLLVTIKDRREDRG
tara:strand:+ start:374 stop:658 length:285 start_codon:yes stop_codon:yes gene_type:complete